MTARSGICPDCGEWKHTTATCPNAKSSTDLEQLAREWLTQHYLGRGWDEEDATALAALLARVQRERDERWTALVQDVQAGHDSEVCYCTASQACLEILRRAEQEEGK